MLLGATTESNMVDILNLEENPLRAHHREEVELSIDPGNQLRGYLYIDLNANKQTDRGTIDLSQNTGKENTYMNKWKF